MEDFAAQPVRGHQEVHCRPHHQDELRSGSSGERKNIPQQTQHDSRPGNYFISVLRFNNRGPYLFLFITVISISSA